MSLVERESLVGRLRAMTGTGSVVAITGEAGAGKTSLVAAALSHAHWGWCDPAVTPRTLGPFRDLGVVAAVHGDAVTTGEELLARARTEPFTVVIEDAHWIDDASADVLRFLGRRLAGTRGLVVVTFRDELGAGHPLRRVLGDLATSAALSRIVVPPLSAGGVATLVAGTGLDPVEAARLTGGNAFLVSQLVESPSAGVTADVQDMVAARLQRLPERTRDVVELLSVIPGRVPLAVVVDRGAAVDEAEAAGLLRVGDTTVTFRHELVRLAVAGQLTHDVVRRRHAEALALRRTLDTEPGALATHARGAGLTAEAYTWDVAAAERAAAAGAHHQAAEHFRRAIDEGMATGSELARLLVALSTHAYALGRDDEAVDAARAAVPAASEDPMLHGDALRWLGRVTPDSDESHRIARQAVDVLAPYGETPQLAHARAQLATNRMLARDLGPALAGAVEAIELARRTGATDAEITALQVLGTVRVLTGDDDGAHDLREAVRVAQAAGHPEEVGRAWSNLVSAAGEARRYDLSAAATQEALGHFTSRDLDTWTGYTWAWAARCLFEQGRWSEATAYVDRVLAQPEPLSRINLIAALTTQGRIRARRGDPHVRESLDRAHELADASGALQRLWPVTAARAEARWLAGEPDDGTTGLLEVYGLAVELRHAWAVGELGHWLHRRDLVGSLPSYAAEPYRLQVAGDHDGAARAWLAIGCPYEAADAWSDSEDETGLQRALEVLDGLGARPLRLRTARRLRQLGVRSVPRGPREATAADPHGLTAREQEVLGCLEQALTDAEIAARLHLSVKTVGHHVSAVLRKTGSTSRRQLAGPR